MGAAVLGKGLRGLESPRAQTGMRVFRLWKPDGVAEQASLGQQQDAQLCNEESPSGHPECSEPLQAGQGPQEAAGQALQTRPVRLLRGSQP